MTSTRAKTDDLTTVATAALLQEADVMCSVLRSAGIDAVVLGDNASSMLSYMSFAINPNGIRVVVRPKDAPSAYAVLTDRYRPEADADGTVDEEDHQDTGPTPDDCASKAVMAALFVWWCPPFMIAVIYWLKRSSRARLAARVENMPRYRRRIAFAVLVGVVIPATAILSVFGSVFGAGTWLRYLVLGKPM